MAGTVLAVCAAIVMPTSLRLCLPLLVGLHALTACSGDWTDPEDPGTEDPAPEGPADGDPNGQGSGYDGPTADGVPLAVDTEAATSPATCDTAVEVYQAKADGTLG